MQVTDNGKPLWTIQPAANEENDEQRGRAIDEILDDVLQGRRSDVSLSGIIDDSRR